MLWHTSDPLCDGPPPQRRPNLASPPYRGPPRPQRPVSAYIVSAAVSLVWYQRPPTPASARVVISARTSTSACIGSRTNVQDGSGTTSCAYAPARPLVTIHQRPRRRPPRLPNESRWPRLIAWADQPQRRKIGHGSIVGRRHPCPEGPKSPRQPLHVHPGKVPRALPPPTKTSIYAYAQLLRRYNKPTMQETRDS